MLLRIAVPLSVWGLGLWIQATFLYACPLFIFWIEYCYVHTVLKYAVYMHCMQTKYTGNQLNLPICAVYRKVCSPNMQCNAINFPFFPSKLTKEANIISMKNMYFSCHLLFSLFGGGLGRLLFLQLSYINVSFISCKRKWKYIWKICRDMQLIR